MVNPRDECPKFAGCPIVWLSQYYYVRHTCLTTGHVNCAQFMSQIEQEKVDEVGDGCSRLDYCLEKTWQPRERLIKEYIARVCLTPKYVYCGWYLVWHLNGRDPESDMTDTKINDEYRDYLNRVIERVVDSSNKEG